jgi:hypothetical protein
MEIEVLTVEKEQRGVVYDVIVIHVEVDGSLRDGIDADPLVESSVDSRDGQGRDRCDGFHRSPGNGSGSKFLVVLHVRIGRQNIFRAKRIRDVPHLIARKGCG